MFKTDYRGIGCKMTIALEGRLDNTSAPKLDEEIKKSLGNVTDLTIDASKLEYISSEGLRVLLTAQKIMDKQGNMVIKNVSEEVNKAFEETGFSRILTIL